MLSFGIEFSLAFWIALARAALPSGLPPPSFAATWIARASLVNRAPRLASFAPFWCLIELHLEWPDMRWSLERRSAPADLAGEDLRGCFLQLRGRPLERAQCLGMAL